MTSVTTDRRFGINQGIALKAPCDLATTANITLSGEQTIDGTLTSSSRVFVKNQTTATANGIYRTGTGTWTREPDFDGNRDVVSGTLISVFGGNTLSDTMWRVTNAGTITIDSTSLTFERAAVSDSSTVSFLQSGSGALTTTVQAKLREWVSVLDFGADNTGVADSTTAFTNALTASNEVRIPPGTYKLVTGITTTSKALVGAGSNAVTLNYTGSSIAITTGGSDTTSPTLQGFTLTGTASANGGILISVASTGCRRGKFRDVLVSGFTKAGKYGWDLAASLNNGIYYNLFDTCRSDSNANGWRIYSSDGAANGNRCNANTWVNCTAISNTSAGFTLDYANGNAFVGCDREQNGTYAFDTDHCYGLAINGGYSEGNTSGWLKKTANGRVHVYCGHIVDAATSSIVYAVGDVILIDTIGLSVRADGGMGIGGASPVANGLNFVATSNATLQASGTTYMTLDTTNGLLLHSRAARMNGTTKSSSAGALSFAGVQVGYVEVTLTENVTAITMPTAVDGYELEIVFTNGAGPYTVAGWPAAVLLAGGAFAVTATNGKRDRIAFRYHADYSKWIEVGRTANM